MQASRLTLSATVVAGGLPVTVALLGVGLAGLGFSHRKIDNAKP